MQAFEYWVPSLKEGSVRVLYRLHDSFSNSSIVIASYDTLSRASAKFVNEDFQMVIAVSNIVIAFYLLLLCLLLNYCVYY